MTKVYIGDINHIFRQDAVHQGREYYLKDAVDKIAYKNGTIKAIVDDGEKYNLKILIKNKKVVYGECNCSYFKKAKHHCKHILAVLFILERYKLEELDKEVNEKNPLISLEESISIVEKGISKYKNENGLIKYGKSKYFFQEIQSGAIFIYRLIRQEKYEDAFSLIKHMFDLISNTIFDGYIKLDGLNDFERYDEEIKYRDRVNRVKIYAYCTDEYAESYDIISITAKELLKIEEYYDKFFDYAINLYIDRSFKDNSDIGIDMLIDDVSNSGNVNRIRSLITVYEKYDKDLYNGRYGSFVASLIDIVYRHIDNNEAIDMCYKHLDDYQVLVSLLRYYKSDNKYYNKISVLEEYLKNYRSERRNLEKLYEALK